MSTTSSVSPEDGSSVRRRAAGSSTLGKWVIGGFIAVLVILAGLGVWNKLSSGRPTANVIEHQALDRRDGGHFSGLPKVPQAPTIAPVVVPTEAPLPPEKPRAPIKIVELQVGVSQDILLQADGWTPYIEVSEGMDLHWQTIPSEAPVPSKDAYTFPDGTKKGPKGEILRRYSSGARSSKDAALVGMRFTLYKL